MLNILEEVSDLDLVNSCVTQPCPRFTRDLHFAAHAGFCDHRRTYRGGIVTTG